MSNLVNKAQEALSGTKHDTTATGAGTQYDDPRSTNAGPHSSNLANKLDPRVDSDRDNRNNPASGVGGFGNNQDSYNTGAGAGTYSGTGAAHPAGGYEDPRSTNAGPHSSNLANKVDPRVDSNRNHRNDPTSDVGGYGTQASYGAGGATGTSAAAYGGSTHSTNTGPHSSNLANKLDPRVDSDRDGRNDPASRVGGYGQTQGTYGAGTTGATTGYGGTAGAQQYDDPRSTNAGPHSSNLANKADPRVDSDRDGRNETYSRSGGQGDPHYGHGTSGSGIGSGVGTSDHTASGQTTAGGLPSVQHASHDSKLLNKLDPRVKTDKEGNPTH